MNLKIKNDESSFDSKKQNCIFWLIILYRILTFFFWDTVLLKIVLFLPAHVAFCLYFLSCFPPLSLILINQPILEF